MLKKVLIGTAAAAMVAAPMAASAAPWGHERWDHERWDHDRGGDAGAAVAAGIFGLAIGAALASNHHDYGYGYDYDDYDGGYYGSYDYAPVRCHWETRAYPGPWGGVSYQNVRVCYR